MLYAAALTRVWCLQVRQNLQGEPVRGAHHSVGRPGAEPVHTAERGAAVRVQLPEEHRRDTRQVVHAGSGGRNAPGHEDHLPQLHEQRPPALSAAARGREAHLARLGILETKSRVLRPRRSQESNPFFFFFLFLIFFSSNYYVTFH